MKISFIIIYILIKLNLILTTEVHFTINSVPKYYTPINDDLYVSGNFNNWVPNDENFKLKKVTSNSYSLNVSIPLGVHAYKITRGSWAKVETNQDGSAMSNRLLQLAVLQQTATISVANWDDFKGKHTASGNVNVLDSNFQYIQFNTTKRIWIYLPSDYYTSSKTYPVIYMHDGQNLFDQLYSFMGEWGIDESMENFNKQGKPTSIVVGIETTVNRMDELTPHKNPQYGGGQADKYVDFLVNDLKQYVDKFFRTKPEREFTGIGGSSLGGLFSFYAGLQNQNVFSKIAVFSPSFWFSDKIYTFASSQTQQYNDFKLYFLCGAQESQSMATDMTKMINQLKTQGFKNIISVIQADGQHSEWFWNREFPNAYNWLYLI